LKRWIRVAEVANYEAQLQALATVEQTVVALVGDAPHCTVQGSQLLHCAFPRLQGSDSRGEVEVQGPSVGLLVHGDDELGLATGGPFVSVVDPEAGVPHTAHRKADWGNIRI
jgi:hypothetical protein